MCSDFPILPSLTWNGQERLSNSQNTPYRKLILEFLERIDLNILCQLASNLHGGVDCQVSEQFTFGSENVIREIVFKDGNIWIARLYFRAVEAGMVRSEAITMKYVKEHTTLPVPDVFGYNASCDNALGSPYIFMEAIHGRHHALKSFGPVLDIPQDKRAMVCRQLADYLSQLNSLRFPALGALDIDEHGAICLTDVFRVHDKFPRCKEPTQYYRHIALSSLQRFGRFQSLCFAAWLQLLLAKQMGKSATSDYPLAHPDFTAQNILFDDEYNIVGILDWSYAHTVPTELFCAIPGGWFLRPDSFLDDIPPEWRDKIEERHRIQKSLRQEILAALREVEQATGTELKLSQLFDDVKTKRALMFNEYYEAQISELYEWVFGKIYSNADIQSLREWFFQQDLDILVENEKKEASSISGDLSQRLMSEDEDGHEN